MNRTDGPIQVAEIAALVGDPARANILLALMAGRALTAGELAYAAGVTAQTASGHLTKLREAGLLDAAKQGRHQYYRIAGPPIAQMLESIMAVAVHAPPRHRPASRADEAMCAARTCYDHLAGRLGVALADVLCARGHVVLADDGGEVTGQGLDFLTGFGLDLGQARRGRRTFCRACIDWTERRPHIGGSIGAALAARCFDLGWIARTRDSRAVALTPVGRAGFAETFGFTT